MISLLKLKTKVMNKRFIALLFSAVVVSSCSTGDTKKEEKQEKKTIKLAAESCKYAYDETAVTVAWTAFKFTEKKGVGGQFDEVSVQVGGAVDKPVKLLNDLSFSIPTTSTNTNNPDRDKKIVESFFNTMNTATIEGTVLSTDGDEQSGKAVIALTMNGTTVNQEMDYTVEGNKVSLLGTIDVLGWNGGDAITALNAVCEELHKGEDGVSKLWPTVDVEISAILKKDCK